MTRFLLKNATVLTVDAADTAYEKGWIAVEDGRIAALGPAGSEPEGFDAVQDLAGHLVMPGLVNAHTHSPMILFRGVAEGQSLLTMDGWYNAIREPELSLVAEDIPPAVALSCAEMLLSGTTTFCEQYFFADEIAGAVRKAGIRAVIAYGIVQLGDPEVGVRELARAEAFLASQRSADGRVIPWFGPHAPYVDNTAELLQAEVEIANKYGSGLHMHMAAGPEDNDVSLKLYGKTAAVALEETGFFNGRVHVAHCLDLSEEDIAVFARAPAASVAYCATAGLRSGREGICPVIDLRAAGVTVGIGTDNVAANNSYDMVQEMRVAGLVASHREGVAQPISSRDLIRMATIEGARALGLDHEIGSLEVGKSADIISIDMRGPGWSPTPDVETALVYSGSGRDVQNVWVQGEALVRDRALVRTQYETVRTEYEAAHHVFWARVQAAKMKAT
ncbi:5-methylthioadenosine/S-adenosylhomocysteine deaminase [Ketogulonicigenium robustum]|uniref:5-methylthioadenosine/S-adenosylhomocysteine deaminase n=1 Tax=Ketogulonicigenium robustum TaxID=92947 RepID=A0A1W6NY55_9RHOB|nr:amidohydrolase [Ketogulonicigenium robustum]ARO14178.1 5-methylthioadenosine/S-adenosylhomocysteine deaminase [Ketogulonicigenium robustum]